LQKVASKINQRPLVNVERLLYRAPYCDIIMMARFNQRISEESLKTSLEKAKLKYPMMSARIEQDNEGNASFAFDCIQDFRVKVLTKKTDSEWFDQAWQEQKEPFDLKNGPLIKFLLLSSTDSSDLVVICHHAICDGLSLVYLIKDIALFINEPTMEVQPLPVPPSISGENFVINVKPGWAYRIILGYLNRSWNRVKTTFSEDDYRQLYKKYWESRDIGMTSISLSKEMTASLISRCHEEHVTVNSMLTTAFSLAQYDIEGRKQAYLKKALIAINIRKFFKNPPGDNFGFLAAGIQVDLPYGKSGFWDIARGFNTKVKGYLAPKNVLGAMVTLNSLDPTLIDAIYFTAYSSFKNKTAQRLKNLLLTPTDKPRRSMDITNLGDVKISENTNLETIFFVPILSPNYEKAIGIVTAGGVLNIVMLYDRSQISTDTIEKFKQMIINYIKTGIS
jgi:NRPS condensation-like uncharacterized protein